MKKSEHWFLATVVKKTPLTPTVTEILLRGPEGQTPYWHAGAHLRVRIKVNGEVCQRSYSLVGQPDQEHWKIAIKCLEQGRGGSKAMTSLELNDCVEITAPHNFFALDNSAKSYLLIAAGIGVTPLLGMAQALASRDDQTQIRMLYAARNRNELAYLETLQSALGERLEIFLSDENQWIDYDHEIQSLPQSSQLYTCGPVPVLEKIRQAWQQAQRPIADLRFETFGASGHSPTLPFELLVPRHQLHSTVPADRTLLETLQVAGVPTLHNCTRGECGICAMDIIEFDGKIDHRDVFLSAEEKAHCKKICVCVSRVIGSITLDSSYRPENQKSLLETTLT